MMNVTSELLESTALNRQDEPFLGLTPVRDTAQTLPHRLEIMRSYRTAVPSFHSNRLVDHLYRARKWHPDTVQSRANPHERENRSS